MDRRTLVRVAPTRASLGCPDCGRGWRAVEVDALFETCPARFAIWCCCGQFWLVDEDADGFALRPGAHTDPGH
ncbi:MAG: hypothetical protein K6V97_03710 [Actinomycetia bacterium]|nr:hypothetical protein [Actinomycetes bacterium]